VKPSPALRACCLAHSCPLTQIFIGQGQYVQTLMKALLLCRYRHNAKSRQIPLHPSVLAALTGYARLRDQHVPQPTTPALLVSTAGTRLISQGIHYVFARLVRQAGLQPRSPECRPRLHDFRHSLAVATLLGWYREGLDVQARLPLLATLLGHSQPANTYWYYSDSRVIPIPAPLCA